MNMNTTLSPFTTALKIDSRGRVRFTSQGYRFEITKNGMNVYVRENIYGRPQETLAWINANRISNRTLLLITEAVNLVNA